MSQTSASFLRFQLFSEKRSGSLDELCLNVLFVLGQRTRGRIGGIKRNDTSENIPLRNYGHGAGYIVRGIRHGRKFCLSVSMNIKLTALDDDLKLG